MGGPAVDAIGVRPVFWLGGGLFYLDGALGLILLTDDDRRGSNGSHVTASSPLHPNLHLYAEPTNLSSWGIDNLATSAKVYVLEHLRPAEAGDARTGAIRVGWWGGRLSP